MFHSKLRKTHAKFWFCRTVPTVRGKLWKLWQNFQAYPGYQIIKLFPGFQSLETFPSTVPKPNRRDDTSTTSLVVQVCTQIFESIRGIVKLYFKKKIEIYSIRDLTGYEWEARRAVVLLTRNPAGGGRWLCLWAGDGTVCRDGPCTLGDKGAMRTSLWKAEIWPGVCTFIVNYEATSMFW